MQAGPSPNPSTPPPSPPCHNKSLSSVQSVMSFPPFPPVQNFHPLQRPLWASAFSCVTISLPISPSSQSPNSPCPSAPLGSLSVLRIGEIFLHPLKIESSSVKYCLVQGIDA